MKDWEIMLLKMVHGRYTAREYRAEARDINRFHRELRKEDRSHIDSSSGLPIYTDEYGRNVYKCPYGLVRQ